MLDSTRQDCDGVGGSPDILSPHGGDSGAQGCAENVPLTKMAEAAATSRGGGGGKQMSWTPPPAALDSSHKSGKGSSTGAFPDNR